MKRLAAILPLLLLLAALFGCGSRTRVSARLDALDTLVSRPPSGPPSAALYDSVLQVLDTLMYDVVGLGEDVEARWHLLYAAAEDKADRPLLFDTHVRPAYDYYRDATQDGTQGDSTLLHRFAQSCFYMGVHYYHSDSTVRIEQMMQKSVNVAKSCGDHYTAYQALNYLSRQIKSTNSSEAISLVEDALVEYKKSRHHYPYNEITLLLNVGLCYFSGDIHIRDKALSYYQQALECSLEHDSLMLTEVYSHMVYYYIQKKDPTLANVYFQKIKQQVSLQEDKYSVGFFANVYFAADSLEKAREFMEMFLPMANQTEKYYSFLCLQKIALLQHSEAEALSLTDSLRYYAWAMSYEKSKDVYLLNKEAVGKGQQIERLERKNLIQIVAFVVSGTILLFIVCLIFIVFRQRHKRQRHLTEIEKMRRQMTVEREQHQQRLAALQIQVKEAEIEQKNKKLSYLKSYIEKQSIAIETFKSSTDRALLSLTEEDWQSLEVALDDIYDNFILKLRTSFPQMKEDMVRLCMLQKIGMTNRDISNIFFITLESVKKRKQRLKKELFPNAPKEQTFEEIIEKSVDFIR